VDTKRFHDPGYKRQVRARRSYSRPVRKLPETTAEKFFYAVGLGTWFRKILAGFILLLILYLIYFAPFLQIKELTVLGADQFAAAGIQQRFNDFSKRFRFGFPERNIIFFQTGVFGKKILASDPDVSSVISVKRKTLRQIEITVDQRLPAFNLQVQNNFYILNSDGTIGSPTQTANSNLGTIIDTADQSVTPGQRLFSADKAGFLQYINANFSAQTQGQIDHYAVPGIASSDLILFTKSGAKIYFDSTMDPKTDLQRFFTIWSGLNPAQRAKIGYVDLRFDPKAFLCFQTDPCASSQ